MVLSLFVLILHKYGSDALPGARQKSGTNIRFGHSILVMHVLLFSVEIYVGPALSMKKLVVCEVDIVLSLLVPI